uniref:Transposase n=1 Tax=Steinernema glaseri TaxID=37863 RepID=A0A1I7ZXY2_9BILA
MVIPHLRIFQESHPLSEPWPLGLPDRLSGIVQNFSSVDVLLHNRSLSPDAKGHSAVATLPAFPAADVQEGLLGHRVLGTDGVYGFSRKNLNGSKRVEHSA